MCLCITLNMLWFITLTQDCNLKCTYCGSFENHDIEDFSPHPRNISYNVDDIQVLSKDPEAIVCFYGGEPLLRRKLIRQVIEECVPEAKFVLQTNGVLLHKLEDNLLHRMDAILVSLDGVPEMNDKYRGDGSFNKALLGAEYSRKNGYNGDLIARMTVTEDTDIERDVLSLLGLKVFDHVHWQLNVLWDSPKFSCWTDFIKWRDESYVPGIRKLAIHFLAKLKEGTVLGIAPFLGILYTLLSGEKITQVRCGSGSSAFNITTGGIVTACPIAPDDDRLSNLSGQFDPLSVKNSVSVGEPCTSCDYMSVCGGRCLYANKTKWWGEDGFEEVCVTIKETIEALKELVPEIEILISSGDISLGDFRYPPYNNSVEVIP